MCNDNKIQLFITGFFFDKKWIINFIALKNTALKKVPL